MVKDAITYIPLVKSLTPYFSIAEKEAKQSPCVRRQYGALLAYRVGPSADFPNIGLSDETSYLFETSHNKRISPCCNNMCARDRVQTRHGGSVEIGGEIHAETSLLIKRQYKEDNKGYFILVGFEKGKQLYGANVYPCHSCAMAIKFAGYSHIFIRLSPSEIGAVSVSEIIEHRIEEWEPVD